MFARGSSGFRKFSRPKVAVHAPTTLPIIYKENTLGSRLLPSIDGRYEALSRVRNAVLSGELVFYCREFFRKGLTRAL